MTDWDRRYREREHETEDANPIVTNFAGQIAPGSALDLACGTGRHAIWLAQHGWTVTAVDSSRVALDILQQRALDRGIAVNIVLADLERHEFAIEPESYDLIVVCNYLQRDLFPVIRAGVRIGGAVIAVIATVDSDPNVRSMNPEYLLNPGELRAQFEGWELIHDFEGKPAGDVRHRATAEIIARRRPQRRRLKPAPTM
jgi:tellurite methyltransferase